MKKDTNKTSNSSNFKRNNLDTASSPYLSQHKDDPIYWQQWNEETLEYARKNNKLLFVSVGYATCHWCHVMAHDTFSDEEIAEQLNTHFVSIKVDREERPDIDHYLMTFASQTQGINGWPLNVFLTPDLKPFGAIGYAAPLPRYGMPAFGDIVERVQSFYSEYKNQIEQYTLPTPRIHACKKDTLIPVMYEQFDTAFGGFGDQQKFPPHTTLLFLLSYYAETENPHAHEMIERTLEAMSSYGLQDHLQGGFFRYCVDQAWQIPHFEKMLYDQALLLWSYSAAFKLFGHQEYKRVAEKLITCLEETFKSPDQLYYAGHDADTNGVEGATYTWSYKELQEQLTPGELREFLTVYKISEEGNFEERNHLTKWNNKLIDNIEQKLLDIRKNRPQPAMDTTIITSWNALLGVAYVIAARFLPHADTLAQAQTIFDQLQKKHIHDNTIYHSSVNNKLNKHAFLEDTASMLLLATYLYEETRDKNYKNFIEHYGPLLDAFYKDGIWYEPYTQDFTTIPAAIYDQPTPSSVSLVEYALTRIESLFERPNDTKPDQLNNLDYGVPLIHDFYNLALFEREGNTHVITAPDNLHWHSIPYNSLQRPGCDFQSCYRRQCKRYTTVEELVNSLK